jgi:hypothetical protein
MEDFLQALLECQAEDVKKSSNKKININIEKENINFDINILKE